MTKRQENIATVVMLLVFVFFAVGSLWYGPRARFVPLPISIIAILVALAQLYVQNSKSAKKDLGVDTFKLFGADRTKEEMEAASDADREAEESLQKIKIAAGKAQMAYGLPLIFTGLIFAMGFNIAILLFVTWYFRFLNKGSWLVSLAYGIGTWVFVYLMFETVLVVGLYPGVIALWLKLAV
jgi:hypothetical protein